MATVPRLVLLLVISVVLGKLPTVHGQRCLGNNPEKTWVPIAPLSCKKRK